VAIPVPPAQPKVAWETEAPAALDRARTKGRPTLLFFMAPWDTACREMDRSVFHQPELQAVWGDFTAIRVNVDLRANRDICRTWQPGVRVPAFAVLGADRSLIQAWSGAVSAETLALRLVRGRAQLPEEFRDARPRATRALAAGKVEPLRDLIARLYRAGEKTWVTRLSLMECREHAYLYRWARAAEAAELALLRSPGVQEAIRIRARALFRTGGIVEPATTREIQKWIGELGHSDDAIDRLTLIAEPAMAALMDELFHGNGDRSRAAARCVGRIRNSRVLPDLIDALADTDRWVPVRVRIAIAMREWADPTFLSVLMTRMRDPVEATVVRAACADAIARIGASQGGLYGATIVEPLFRALDEGNRELTEAVVRALAEVSENFDLARLFPAMRRSDAACRLFLLRAGQRIRASELPPNAGALIALSWDGIVATSEWDATLRRYVPRSN